MLLQQCVRRGTATTGLHPAVGNTRNGTPLAVEFELGVLRPSRIALIEKPTGFGLEQRDHVAAFDVVLVLIVLFGRERALVGLLGQELDASGQLRIKP